MVLFCKIQVVLEQNDFLHEKICFQNKGSSKKFFIN